MPSLQRLIFTAVLLFSIFQIAGTAVSTALSEHRCDGASVASAAVTMKSGSPDASSDDCGEGHCGFVCGTVGHAHITPFISSPAQAEAHLEHLQTLVRPSESDLPTTPHLRGLKRPPRV